MRNPLLLSFLAFLFTIAVGVIASGAFAQIAGAPRISKECRQEIMAICPRGDDPHARRDCIILNRAKISAPCQAELKARMEAMRAMRGNRKAQPEMPMPTPPITPSPASTGQ